MALTDIDKICIEKQTIKLYQYFQSKSISNNTTILSLFYRYDVRTFLDSVNFFFAHIPSLNV